MPLPTRHPRGAESNWTSGRPIVGNFGIPWKCLYPSTGNRVCFCGWCEYDIHESDWDYSTKMYICPDCGRES